MQLLVLKDRDRMILPGWPPLSNLGFGLLRRKDCLPDVIRPSLYSVNAAVPRSSAAASLSIFGEELVQPPARRCLLDIGPRPRLSRSPGLKLSISNTARHALWGDAAPELYSFRRERNGLVCGWEKRLMRTPATALLTFAYLRISVTVADLSAQCGPNSRLV